VPFGIVPVPLTVDVMVEVTVWVEVAVVVVVSVLKARNRLAEISTPAMIIAAATIRKLRGVCVLNPKTLTS
jgi:hypothetical protein